MSAKRNFTDQEYERLSAYLDGALNAPERAALESQLAADDDLRTELEALRETVELVQTSPTMRAPRDFRLTAEMVRPNRWLIFPTTTAFSALAAAAAMLLIFFGASLLLEPHIGGVYTGVVSALQQNSEAQVAVQPTAITDGLYGATASFMAQTGGGTLGETNDAFASSPQDETSQQAAPSESVEGSPTVSAFSEEAEQGQTAPSAGLAVQGTQVPPQGIIPEAAGETNAQEAPDNAVGQAANAPSPAMADQALMAATDTAGAERAAPTPTLMRTSSPTPTMVATNTATPTLVPAINPPSPTQASPASVGNDILPPVLLILGGLLLIVAVITSWKRWRKR